MHTPQHLAFQPVNFLQPISAQPASTAVLQNGVPISGLDGSAGTTLNYTFKVPTTPASGMIVNPKYLGLSASRDNNNAPRILTNSDEELGSRTHAIADY